MGIALWVMRDIPMCFGCILIRRQFFLDSKKVPRRETETSPEVKGGGASLRDPRFVSGSMLNALIWQRQGHSCSCCTMVWASS